MFSTRRRKIASYGQPDVRRKRTCSVAICAALVSCATFFSRAERPLEQTSNHPLTIPASRIHSAALDPQLLDPPVGIGPDEAGTIALFLNPALRSIRDRRGLATAQLIHAGIVPNVVLSYERDYVTGG